MLSVVRCYFEFQCQDFFIFLELPLGIADIGIPYILQYDRMNESLHQIITFPPPAEML